MGSIEPRADLREAIDRVERAGELPRMIRRLAAIALLALLAGCQAVAFVYGNRPSPDFDCIPGSVTRPCGYNTPG